MREPLALVMTLRQPSMRSWPAKPVAVSKTPSVGCSKTKWLYKEQAAQEKKQLRKSRFVRTP